MGAGLSVRNESEVPILVIASQLTPLHWGKCLPGETWNAANEQKMGKVSRIFVHWNHFTAGKPFYYVIHVTHHSKYVYDVL